MRMTYMVAICFALLAGTAPGSSAEEFVPQPLELDVELEYDSQTIYRAGTHPVIIRVGVYGHDAMVFVGLKDHMQYRFVEEPIQYWDDWRYVNNVDTLTAVFSPKFAENGTEVEFTHLFEQEEIGSVCNCYTVWAYSTEAPQQVFVHTPVGGGTIINRDYEGNTYDRPVYFSSPQYTYEDDNTMIRRERWIIGSDTGAIEPNDWTWYTGEHTVLNGNFADVTSWREGPMFIPSPYQPDIFYVSGYGTANNIGGGQAFGAIRKFRWVSGGEAELQGDWWGKNGSLRVDSRLPGSVTPEAAYIDNDQFVLPVIGNLSGRAELVRIDAIDGYEIDHIDLSAWWNAENGFTDNEWYAPERLRFRIIAREPLLALSNHLSRLAMIINPHDEDEDYLRVVNAVPDNYDGPLLVERPSVGANSPVLTMNHDGWMFYPLSGPDTAFGILTNHGGGIGQFPLSGGAPESEFHIVDYGSVFDGLYMDRRDAPGLWHVPFMSAQEEFGVMIDIFGKTDVEAAMTGTFSLGSNHPNPFNPVTAVPFSLSHEAVVTIDILTTAGTVAATLTERVWPAGHHAVTWDASGMASGTYFYRMRAGEFSTIQKMMLVK